MIPVAPVHITIPKVPFYSQFVDIHTPSWQKIGCGVTSLAMVINYYTPDTVSVDKLLKEGIAYGAYNVNAGWIHKGLISLSKKYGLAGSSYDLSTLSQDASFAKLSTFLTEGPVIVSIHYKFDPKSSIPHLVVLDGIKDGIIFYNDPAAKSGQKQISVADFERGWKKKVIVIRPVEKPKENPTV
jgi:ABC-type bacteriocin/lantibiotic exporter with double-glycine peptidase domain